MRVTDRNGVADMHRQCLPGQFRLPHRGIAKKFCKWRERGSRGFGLDYLLQWFQEYDETNCVLKGNVLQGDNGIHKNKYVTISDANKLYTHRYDKSY